MEQDKLFSDLSLGAPLLVYLQGNYTNISGCLKNAEGQIRTMNVKTGLGIIG